MPGEPRIRDLCGQYQQGRVTFDAVIEAAEEILASYEPPRSADESNLGAAHRAAPGSPPPRS